MVSPRKSNRREGIIRLAAWMLIIVAINILVGFYPFRIDLTSDHRYSLTKASIELAKSIDDLVYVRVYLDGDLPAGYQHLRESTKDMLDEFRAYSGANLEYTFIDPSDVADDKARAQAYQNLSDAGLQYTTISSKEVGEASDKVIFPGAIFSYKGKEVPMQILKTQLNVPEDVMINNSEQQIEYGISTAIRKLVNKRKKKIAFIYGHGEADAMETADIAGQLGEYYFCKRVKINGQLNALKSFDAAMVIAPDSAFSDKDKFIMDQFLMRGGKLVFFLDGTDATMDSLRHRPMQMALSNDVRLDDMLFKYGLRLNHNLILDMEARPIPMVTGMVGNQPKQQFFPWPFAPLLIPGKNINNPVSRNLDALYSSFVSTIDTVNPGYPLHRTVLLSTSQYTRLAPAPTRVSFSILRNPMNPRMYKRGAQITGIICQGVFESLFLNRIPPAISSDKNIGFKEHSEHTSLVLVSDGDIPVNRVSRAKSQYFPLGFDNYTNRMYANSEFILNLFNYLLDDSGLIEARGKQFRIRLLDPKIIKTKRTLIQVANIAIPILSVLVFAILFSFVRKRQHTNKNRPCAQWIPYLITAIPLPALIWALLRFKPLLDAAFGLTLSILAVAVLMCIWGRAVFILFPPKGTGNIN